MNDGLIDSHSHIGVDLFFYLRGLYPYAQDWPTLARAANENGISNVVVFPMVTHLALGFRGLHSGLIETMDALESVPYAFENRRMMEEIHRFSLLVDMAIPFWMVDPARAPLEQISALRTLREEFPCAGLKIQATIIQSPIDALLSSGAAFLDLAQEWDVPFIIHTAVAPGDPWSQVEDILRVVQSRPGVRFSLAHSCRFDRAALDKVAELENAWFDCSAHRIACRLAVDDHPAVAQGDRRFRSDYRNPAEVLADLATAYPHKLCWGSDAPFDSYADADISLCSSYREEAGDLKSLPPEIQQRIARTNTLRFLNLKLSFHA